MHKIDFFEEGSPFRRVPGVAPPKNVKIAYVFLQFQFGKLDKSVICLTFHSKNLYLLTILL